MAGFYGAIWCYAKLAAPDPAKIAAVEQSVYYAGCREARLAGAAPIHRGQPGYRIGMDGDGDGVACEPFFGRADDF